MDEEEISDLSCVCGNIDDVMSCKQFASAEVCGGSNFWLAYSVNVNQSQLNGSSKTFGLESTSFQVMCVMQLI